MFNDISFTLPTNTLPAALQKLVKATKARPAKVVIVMNTASVVVGNGWRKATAVLAAGCLEAASWSENWMGDDGEHNTTHYTTYTGAVAVASEGSKRKSVTVYLPYLDAALVDQLNDARWSGVSGEAKLVNAVAVQWDSLEENPVKAYPVK